DADDQCVARRDHVIVGDPGADSISDWGHSAPRLAICLQPNKVERQPDLADSAPVDLLRNHRLLAPGQQIDAVRVERFAAGTAWPTEARFAAAEQRGEQFVAVERSDRR